MIQASAWKTGKLSSTKNKRGDMQAAMDSILSDACDLFSYRKTIHDDDGGSDDGHPAGTYIYDEKVVDVKSADSTPSSACDIKLNIPLDIPQTTSCYQI